jgi:glycerophosphoryl diester phosphodiesterase
MLLLNAVYAQEFIVLPNGHSHNDYTRERPLLDALNYGFTSIEVDVYWQDGRMVVTHDAENLEEKPTIQKLYLDPLRKIIEQNNGWAFKKSEAQLVLMVDLKSEKVTTYLALREVFADYIDLIEWYDGGRLVAGPVKVLLSGRPPLELIQKQQIRYFSVDGTVEQWGKDYPTSLMPRASANYRSYFNWYGNGDMPDDEVKKLRELIDLAHSRNRKVRFWGCPNRPKVWEKLMDEGVDWVNVDDLKGFNEFYRKRISSN